MIFLYFEFTAITMSVDYRGGDDYRRGSSGGGRRDDEDIACKVYVGDLPRDISENDIDHEFRSFGRYE